MDRETGSIYSADSGVDRYHLISISSYDTMKIQNLSFPTVGLTWSVRGLSEILWIHTIASILNAGEDHVLSTESYAPSTRTVHSDEFRLDVSRAVAEC